MALENKYTHQEGRILELEASLDGQTTLTLPKELVESAVVSIAATSTAATKVAAMRAMIQSLVALVSTLSTKTLWLIFHSWFLVKDVLTNFI